MDPLLLFCAALHDFKKWTLVSEFSIPNLKGKKKKDYGMEACFVTPVRGAAHSVPPEMDGKYDGWAELQSSVTDKV